MFDILNYNVKIAFLSFIIIFVVLYLAFKSKIISLIDPLVFHFFWLSANLSFLVVFFLKYGFNVFLVLFSFTFLGYLMLLNKFLLPIAKRKKYQVESIFRIKTSKLLLIYFITVLLYFYSKLDMFQYFLTHSPNEWFLYRFILLQGRQPLDRIISEGTIPIFLYFSFLFIFILKKFKFISWMLLIGYALIGIVSGGRSTLLGLVVFGGTFLLFYKDFFDHTTIKKVNIYGFILIVLSIFISMFVSSFYNKGFTIKDGMFIILNRVIASADGLEYYMLYDGYENLKSGFIPYFLSIFGIYVKGILGIEYKNIGHQLSELAISTNLEFAQGSNYTLPLQITVIGYYFLPLYLLAVSLLTAKLRNIVPKGSLAKQLLLFFLLSKSFFIIADPEYGILTIISFFIIYLLVIYPILKIKMNICYGYKISYSEKDFLIMRADI
jgi:hypothetical protein